MNRRLCLILVSLGIASIAFRQSGSNAGAPFTLTWTEGRCVDCKIAAELGRIQFVSREEAWAVGFTYGTPGSQGSGDFIVVHTKDGGRTWREISETYQHAGDADGPPAFSFLDSERGWIAWWNPADLPKMMRTRDGGRHWEYVSEEPFQRLHFFNSNRGCGTEVSDFLCTDDGGRHWTKTQIPHLRFINRMVFLTPDIGWLAGSDGGILSVFRTTDGGHEWQESRTTPPKEFAWVQDLFFLDQNHGWLITWHLNDGGTYLFLTADGGKTWLPEDDASFQGRDNWAGVVRFFSEKNGLLFESHQFKTNSLLFTSDAGTHWSRQEVPYFVSDCQAFDRDLLCSAGSKSSAFTVLTVHWN